jgi:DNA-binding SARP family transcriptional activator/Flp pilus assembly protein TadD
MLVLGLLGTLSLRDDTGPVPSAARQKRPLGLLAILALGGTQSMSRHRIEAYLWPESSAARARHALDQAVYAIRRSIGGDVVVSTGQDIGLNPALISADVWEFDEAIRRRDWAAAVSLYSGTLLEGFHFGDSRELETWIDAERTRLLGQYRTAIESLAERSAEAGDHAQVAMWRRKLARSDPLSAGATKALVLALVAAGDRAGAVKEARQYQELVRRELEMEPDAEIEEIVSRLSRPPATESANATARESRPAHSFRRTDIPAPLADATQSTPQNGNVARPDVRESLRTRLRLTRSRIATVTAISVVAALIIGALTIRNGQATGSSLGVENAARPGSAVPSPAARDAYLRGVNALDDRTKDGHDKAIAYFRRATELDPEYAEAYAMLAESYVRLGYFGYRPADAMFPKAKAAALQSIQLDSTLASARTALATELIWEHDFAGAETQYRKAIALDPADFTAHQWYGVLLMILRRVPESVAAEKRAAELAPLSLQTQNNYAMFLNASGDHAGALRHFQKTIAEEPDSAWVGRNPWILANMAWVYADNGRYAEASRMIDRALTIVPTSPRALHTLAVILGGMGRPHAALQAFARADTSNDQYAAYRGMVFADQGNADSAFFWFDRQKEWGIQPMLTLQADRHLDPLRGDARFRALLARLRIPTSNP